MVFVGYGILVKGIEQMANKVHQGHIAKRIGKT